MASPRDHVEVPFSRPWSSSKSASPGAPNGDTIAAIIAVSTAAAGGPSQLQAQVGPQAPFSETEFQRFDHSVVPAETNLRSNLFFIKKKIYYVSWERSRKFSRAPGSAEIEKAVAASSTSKNTKLLLFSNLLLIRPVRE